MGAIYKNNILYGGSSGSSSSGESPDLTNYYTKSKTDEAIAAVINDTAASADSTYSSEKITEELNRLIKGDGSNETLAENGFKLSVHSSDGISSYIGLINDSKTTEQTFIYPSRISTPSITLNGTNINNTFAKKSLYTDTHISLAGSNTGTRGMIISGSSNTGSTTPTYGLCLGTSNTMNHSGIVVGSQNMTSNAYGAVIGYQSTVAQYALTLGYGNNTASSGCSIVLGCYADTDDTYSHASYVITAGAKSTIDAFTIGMGTSAAPSNVFRITYDGTAYGKTFVSDGADYAEFISEWADGNPNHEDRVGYMVTIKDDKLYKANEGDFVIGVTSGNPSVIGNGDETYYWKYERDEFNRVIYTDQAIEIPNWVETEDEEGNKTWVVDGTKTDILYGPKLSDSYDANQKYIPRKDRPEWDYVGMTGVLSVRDDGTCIPNHYCKCGFDGIATHAYERGFDTFFVKERISDNVISIILK